MLKLIRKNEDKELLWKEVEEAEDFYKKTKELYKDLYDLNKKDVIDYSKLESLELFKKGLREFNVDKTELDDQI